MSGNNIARHKKINVHYEIVIGFPRTISLHCWSHALPAKEVLEHGKIQRIACTLQSCYL